jgi:hypothetical protein
MEIPIDNILKSVLSSFISSQLTKLGWGKEGETEPEHRVQSRAAVAKVATTSTITSPKIIIQNNTKLLYNLHI